MSRIENALNRSRAAQEPPAGIGAVPKGTPEAELFVGPWEVGTESAAQPPAVPAGAPAEAAPASSTGRIVVTRPSGLHHHENIEEKLVASGNPTAAAIEQYRRLAAKLHQAQVDRQLNSLMVVSAVSGEGKTLTSINLALTLSSSYKRRVLLVDADFRRPSLHEAFGLGITAGLQEAVLNPPESGEMAFAFEVAPGVALLPAGKPTNDPLGALTAERMSTILAEAKRSFDWVIVDTAPLAALSDAHVLKDLVDGAVLVISAGHTHFELVERAVQTLGTDHILGVVLNGVQDQEIDAAYGYAGYYPRK